MALKRWEHLGSSKMSSNVRDQLHVGHIGGSGIYFALEFLLQLSEKLFRRKGCLAVAMSNASLDPGQAIGCRDGISNVLSPQVYDVP